MVRKLIAASLAAAAVACTCAPVAMACWRFTNGASNGYENPPGGCTGNCDAYYSCDGSDSCVSWRLNGYGQCPCSSQNVPCRMMTGGAYDPTTGCCHGGTFMQIFDPNAPTVTIQKCTPQNNGCGFGF
jgi:hypothetical protein